MSALPAAAPDLRAIEAARERIRSVARETPTLRSEQLSQQTGLDVHVKLESLQRTGSFKIRGAFNRIAQIPEAARARGVICASAGNHGQGVAISAKKLGAPATVVMPEEAAYTKVKAIRGSGARVVLHGASYDEAYRRARELCETEGLTYVHAYDDPEIIAGQGTIGLEVHAAVPDLGTMVVPIGGGGLISGIAIALRALRPGVRMVGVVSDQARGALESFRAGRRVEASRLGFTIADGIRVKQPGELTFPIIRALVDDIVEVSEEEIGDAVFTLLQMHKVAVEGAGAAALAAVIAKRTALPPPVCALVSGGNIDLNLLTHAIECGLSTAGTYLAFSTRVADRPGALFKLLNLLAEKRLNVLDVEHHRAGVRNPFGTVEIEIVVETKDPEHGAEVLESLRKAGYEVWRP